MDPYDPTKEPVAQPSATKQRFVGVLMILPAVLGLIGIVVFGKRGGSGVRAASGNWLDNLGALGFIVLILLAFAGIVLIGGAGGNEKRRELERRIRDHTRR